MPGQFLQIFNSELNLHLMLCHIMSALDKMCNKFASIYCFFLKLTQVYNRLRLYKLETAKQGQGEFFVMLQ